VGYKKCTNLDKFKGIKPVVSTLYYRGNESVLWDKCVAVIGSRKMTSYGLQVVEKLVPRLVQDGWTIVSGFMYGVDQAAHRICVECGGKTIAVLGWGIKIPMESNDEKMANEIIKGGGVVVSEWEEQKGALWTFPQRNRIVAGLSSEIYVVEAAQRSGALITAELGIKMGKKIWAVPGPITSRVSAGTNKLIADRKAEMWVPDDARVNVALRYTNKSDIYSLLQNESLSVDELVIKLGKTAVEIMADLTMMLLKGEVQEREGKYFLG
jgi:DNA processing protein